jgi:spermidine/putrescine transport system permease protein
MTYSPSKPKLFLPWQAIFSLLMFVFMYLPIAVLTFYSFNQSAYSARWEGFTWGWYQKFFNDSRILSALGDSLKVAILATAIAAVIGTLMAVGLAKYRFPGKGLYQGIAYLPLIIPLSGGLIELSLGTVVAAHVVFCLSYIALVVSTRLTNLDPHLEEAALDLGATPVQAFVQVLLPELAPAIISGCLLAFVLSMDDFLIASFTAGGGTNTLPMEIFSRIRTGVKPDINALSVVLIVASGLLFGIAEYIRIRGDRQRMKG